MTCRDRGDELSFIALKPQLQIPEGQTGTAEFSASPRQRKLTITITSVNDAPTGTDGIATTWIDTVYAFQATDFGFTDPHDSPANALAGVQITTLPTQGTLSLAGVAVQAGDFVTVEDLNAGRLTFTPPAGASRSRRSRCSRPWCRRWCCPGFR